MRSDGQKSSQIAGCVRMSKRPLPNGSNGEAERDSRGRFLPGNGGGPGNPQAALTARWRAVFNQAVTPELVREAVKQLAKAVRKGERWAVLELLDRTIGRPDKSTLTERVEALEQAIQEQDR